MKTLTFYKDETYYKVKKQLDTYKSLKFLKDGEKPTTDEIFENILIDVIKQEIEKVEK